MVSDWEDSSLRFASYLEQLQIPLSPWYLVDCTVFVREDLSLVKLYRGGVQNLPPP